jgi:hypothetical protein
MSDKARLLNTKNTKGAKNMTSCGWWPSCLNPRVYFSPVASLSPPLYLLRAPCFRIPSQCASNRLTQRVFPRNSGEPAGSAKVSNSPKTLQIGVKPVSKVSFLRLPAVRDAGRHSRFPPATSAHILRADLVGDARDGRQRLGRVGLFQISAHDRKLTPCHLPPLLLYCIS